ncbi:hypothetical protein TSOC_007207, partial [Tetrabaena socialis]
MALARSCSGSLGSLMQQRSASGSLSAAPVPRLTRRTSGASPPPSPLSRSTSCAAATPDGHPALSSPPSSLGDPFAAAGRRLQLLLSRVGDGEDEMLNTLVEQESPESRLQTSVVLGGAVTLGAVVIASLLSVDPWGGAAPSLATLGAAAVGAAAAVPLVAARMWTWSPAAAEAVPALKDVHDGQLEMHRPWLASMSRPQALGMMALEVLPLTVLMFPAGQAAIVAGMAMYGQ